MMNKSMREFPSHTAEWVKAEFNKWLEANPNRSTEMIDQRIQDCLDKKNITAYHNDDLFYYLYAIELAKLDASIYMLLEIVAEFHKANWRIGLTAIREILSAQKLFADIPHDIPLRERVRFLALIRELTPDNRGEILREAMEKFPEKVIELVKTTSFSPMILSYNSCTFDHELENFLFAFNEAGVYRFPEIVKNVWDKLVKDTPEHALYGLDFLNEYIENHPNWKLFAQFVFNDLFDGPRLGWTDTRAVINRLRSVNGFFPDQVVRIIEELPDGDHKASSIFGNQTVMVDEGWRKKTLAEFHKKWEEKEVRHCDFLSIEESRRVIDKINELFFY